LPHSRHLPSGPTVPMQDSSLHKTRFSQSSFTSKRISVMPVSGFFIDAASYDGFKKKSNVAVIP
jgi:hypothetical protein